MKNFRSIAFKTACALVRTTTKPNTAARAIRLRRDCFRYEAIC